MYSHFISGIEHGSDKKTKEAFSGVRQDRYASRKVWRRARRARIIADGQTASERRSIQDVAQRQRIGGRLVSLGLGNYPVITLAKARSKALENARAVADGSDPRVKPSALPTFAESAKVVIDIHRAVWKDAGRSAKIWQSSLDTYAMPLIGAKRVSEVTSADVLGVLMQIWNEKPETARRVKHRISAVMRWAVAQGYRDDNPAGDAINEALPRMNGVKRHRRALHHSKVKGAIDRVRNSEAWESTKLCFEFLTLTAARSGEVRAAHWDEIDLDRRVWTVPAERMKMSREHRVPLSHRAVEILHEAENLNDGSAWCSPQSEARSSRTRR